MFFTYAKRWWNDYLQMRPNLHSDRLVKIFATTEGGCGLVDGGDNHWVNEGGNNSSTSDSALGGRKEPVTSFVRPLRCPFLESPKHAARFVSLIPVERAQNIGASNKMEVWQETHTLLIMGKGDVHDHAVLLCSLLLGKKKKAGIGRVFGKQKPVFLINSKNNYRILLGCVCYLWSRQGK